MIGYENQTCTFKPRLREKDTCTGNGSRVSIAPGGGVGTEHEMEEG